MSTLSAYGRKPRTRVHRTTVADVPAQVGTRSDVVRNHMGGNSFKLSPVSTLRIIAASSIFGEPKYYAASGLSDRAGAIRNLATMQETSILKDIYKAGMSAADIFISAVDNALVSDFKGTLDLAVTLRKEYMMRLNPSVIFVRAALHPNRVAFNEANPGYMKNIGAEISIRPDDITNQFDYFMYLNKSKKGLQSILKRTWADKLASYSRYQLNKYKGKSLIDLVRICHANNEHINELMTTGTLVMPAEDRTWEQLKSEGKSWKQILETIDMPHMALLRNLRGIFGEISDRAEAQIILNKLIGGVLYGKQFPFRYWSAYKAIKGTGIHNEGMVLDALENCLDTSVANMPKLSGRVASLADNSGSAWGGLTSEYGSVVVAEIANLSSLITAMQSDHGEVGIFGDRLSMKEISKRNGLLKQLEDSNKIGQGIGHGTENGIWLFWDKAIREKIHYDTVFIYSDQQAGHGGLYGTRESEAVYRKNYSWKGSNHIDVLKLVETYRQEVNPKVNIFSVQVAGYNNTVLPEDLYRGAVLAGWTGKEPVYAKAIIDTWNQIEGVQ